MTVKLVTNMPEQIKSFFNSQEFAVVALLALVVGSWVSMSADFMPPFVRDAQTQREIFIGASTALLTALKMASSGGGK